MCQGEGQVAAPEEDQADAQKQHLRPASTVQGNVTMNEMQPSQMSGDFKRALDLVVPATLVIKCALAPKNCLLKEDRLYILHFVGCRGVPHIVYETSICPFIVALLQGYSHSVF